jgi:hypothetical protein
VNQQTKYRKVGPHLLPVPAQSPANTRAGIVLVMVFHGFMACALIGLVSMLPVSPIVAALFNIVVAAAMVFVNLFIALVRGPRMAEHARRWQQEPSYRQLWERRAAESDE